MSPSAAATVAAAYRETHERLLALAERLSDDELGWRPAGTAPSAAFTLWHLARWADHLQATLPAMTPELGQALGARRQIWEAEGLAAQWGLAGAALGYEETGMLMDDGAAALLALPARPALLDYVRRAFAAADAAVAAVDDAQFAAAEQPTAADDVGEALRASSQTVGGAIVSHLTHDNRHLGMLEMLGGLRGRAGTATR
jgi:hypothetical protein